VNLYYYKNAEPALEKILARRAEFDPVMSKKVAKIVEEVRVKGDTALVKFARQFDHLAMTADQIAVKPEYLRECRAKVDENLMRIIKEAHNNIKRFHEQQIQPSWLKSFGDGVKLGQRITPLDRVGVYVPGGQAFYPSSVLMNVIPAKLAKVREIFVVTPPVNFFKNPLLGAVLSMLEVTGVFLSGGAQGVAALAFGTATVPKVDKIVGPGGPHVALAKRQVFGYVDIDMIAGPSEILVLADAHTEPEWVALDLLSQAEHGSGHEAAILVTDSQAFAEKTAEFVYEHLKYSPQRERIEQVLDEYGAFIIVDDLMQGVEVVNRIAPEHLEIIVRDPEKILAKIRHAGAIFIGPYSAESVGDYWAGPNHVLPTGGSARFFSPLGVYDFVKRSSLIQYSREAILKNAEKIEKFAAAENLPFHGRAVRRRFDDLKARLRGR
jgi:histidinol dehydrogenase